MASIKEIALEAAITREKDVLEKAKEIGISVKSVSTNLTEEESNILYQYITTGKLPDGYKKPSKSKPKSPKKAYSKEKIPTQEPTKEKDTSQNVINAISKTDNLESKIAVSQIKKDDEASNAQQELKQARSARANETANIKGTILQTEATPVIFNEPKKVGKPNIISRGKHNESKLDIKDIKSNQINSNLDKEDRENQAYTDIARQDIKLAIQENKDEMTTAINNDEGIKTESIKSAKEIDKKKSLEDSKLNETNNKNASPVSTSQDMQTLGNLPQGFDPNINKKPKINLVRVIRKNNKKPESNEPKKEREAAQILDSLKHTEHKGKTKKKKEKTAAKQQKQQSHQIINMERDMGVSGYDYEQDEIMLIDMYESPQENLEEKENKKDQIDEKIKVSHYSPWIKEGSIARPSRGRSRKSKEQKAKRNNDVITSLVLPEEIRVYEFAEKANLELGNVLGKLFLLGMKVLKNDFLDKDTIEILAGEYNIDVTIQQNTPLDNDQDELESDLTHRPPVVTIMGHVDHGKTSLLDYIRNSRIVNSEAGGITQHIGAYMVQKNDKWISFIDTPGHEAFAQMRSRGAQVTDIAIIVIAADDGVKQQSIEALNHAKSANVQIIIAMNKIDKEGANLDKLKSECAELGFTPIDWGGDYEFIPISAKTGEGVDVLLETILLQAEILDLKASKTAKAKAIVLEGSQQVGKGSVATIIVRQGVLEIGQCIVADTTYGKVRTLKDDTGKSITKLEPSGVAQITGLSEVPSAGALLQVVENDSIAREIANKRSAYLRQKQLSRSTKVTFDELSSMVAKGQIKSVPIVLRADTQGSLEAIKASLESLNNKEVEINVISFGIGGITQSDINLANASNNCIVLGFNVRPTSDIKHLAKYLGITIKSYSIIYDLIDDMKALLSGLMSPITEEEVVGILSVRETFIVAKIGTIAGCMVLDGKVERNLSVRVLRNGVVMWNGKIASLKRFKDDVKEVTKGYECGIMLDGFNDIVVQDEVEVFKEILKQRTL